MRVLVTRTSEPSQPPEIQEYKDLEDCVDTLLACETLFDKFKPELVISRAKYLDCKWRVEIYDTWRE